MRGIVMPGFMPMSSQPSKAQTVFQVGTCAERDLKETLERIANREPDERGFAWGIVAVNWKTDYYEIVSQKTVFVPLTEEEIAEKREAEEKARAEHLRDLEDKGLTAVGIDPWGRSYQPIKPGPSRMEVDLYKSLFVVIIGMFPSNDFDADQRLNRFGEIMEKVAARLFPDGNAVGPSAALMQAIKELKEGTAGTAEDFPSHLEEE